MELPLATLLKTPAALLSAFPPDALFTEPSALLGVPAEVPDVPGRAEYWTPSLFGGLELITKKIVEQSQWLWICPVIRSTDLGANVFRIKQSLVKKYTVEPTEL